MKSKMFATLMIAGDKFELPSQPEVPLTVLRLDEGTDLFGRELLRYWCRREDTGDEGYVSFGAGAELVVEVERCDS